MSVSPESLQATSQVGSYNSISLHLIGQQANQSGLLQVSGDRILPNNVSHDMAVSASKSPYQFRFPTARLLPIKSLICPLASHHECARRL